MPHPRKTAHALEVTDSDPRWSERAPSELAGGPAKLPPGLSQEAKRHFKRISKALGQRGWESPGDGEILAAYARTFCDMLEAREIVRQEGRMISTTVLSSNGNPVAKRQPHPLLREIAGCESRLAALLRDLGLTLTTRDRPKRPAASAPKGKRYAKPGSVAEQLLRQNPAKAKELWPNLILWEGPDERPE